MRKSSAPVLAVAAAALLPLGVAGPANAEISHVVTTVDGCRVGVSNLVDKSSDGRQQVYNVRFKCWPEKTVMYRVDLREADRGKYGDVGGDNTVSIGPWQYATVGSSLFSDDNAVKTTHSHDIAGDKRGEFYQRVCFRVEGALITRCVSGPITVVRVS